MDYRALKIVLDTAKSRSGLTDDQHRAIATLESVLDVSTSLKIVIDLARQTEDLTDEQEGSIDALESELPKAEVKHEKPALKYPPPKSVSARKK